MKKEIIKRYIMFVAGLFFMGLGVAITRHGELGVSPISSVPNVVSLKLPVLSFGTWLFLWNCVLLVGQALILRKDFKLFQLLQIPLSVLFGWFTDFGAWCISFVPADTYLMKMLMVIAGIVVLGFGISVTINANVILNSGEAFVKAISDKKGLVFGNVKVAFDVSCVVLSILLSLLFFDMQILGTREGTVISALFVGNVVKFFQKNKPDK